MARYIFSKNQIKISDHTVKYSAFIPPRDGLLSVFRISGLQENQIWEVGCGLRLLPLLGRADIKASAVTKTGLSIDADDIPPRHANIFGWPAESSAIKLKAIELAEKAELYLK